MMLSDVAPGSVVGVTVVDDMLVLITTTGAYYVEVERVHEIVMPQVTTHIDKRVLH